MYVMNVVHTDADIMLFTKALHELPTEIYGALLAQQLDPT